TFWRRGSILPSMSQNSRPPRAPGGGGSRGTTVRGRYCCSDSSMYSQVRSVSITCASLSMIGMLSPGRAVPRLTPPPLVDVGVVGGIGCRGLRPFQRGDVGDHVEVEVH